MKQWMWKRNGADLSRIAQRYQISEITAEILVKRGLYTWEAMDDYLFPTPSRLAPARQMKGMEQAVSLLQEKIIKKEKLCIIGDYDVDGIMSTAILCLGLQEMGADVSWRIPHRVHDGYGIRAYMAAEAKEQGVDTLITCDNGISAADAVAEAKRLGMTVIITDHHEVPTDCESGDEILPCADVIIDPKQRECSYPWKELCGAGISYRLIAALRDEKMDDALGKQLLSFAAIATVCDVVPLISENRVLVKNGLEQLQHCENMGLHELIRLHDLQRDLNSRDLGFRIGPCLNAAGRLEDASLSVELLLETDRKRAEEKAARLMELNERRKEMTLQAVEEAKRLIEENGYDTSSVLVLYLPDCQESVAGIVAGRIREQYYRPTLIITPSEGHLKGSGRSIPGYHLQQELNRCSELLMEYGGHALAAGFSLEEKMLPVLRQKLNENCDLKEEDFVEKITFDREVPLGEVDINLVQELELMQPIGEKNPGALFARRGVEVLSVRVFGRENQIGRFQVRDGSRKYSLVDFDIEEHMKRVIEEKYSKAAWEELLQNRGEGYLVDLLYVPEINAKYGDVQYRIVDCR